MGTKPDNSILLVDDDEAKRYTIAKTLVRAGFQLVEAGTGGEALRLVASLPSLVILDVKLPDISGFEVCRRIKSNPATSAIPVLHISTSFVHLEDKLHGLDGGADGYLTNVAEPLELIATVRALLRARRAEDAAQISTLQWQTTFDAISDGVLLLDASGKVVQANRTIERILRRSWTDIVGSELHTLWERPAPFGETLFSKMLELGTRQADDRSIGECWLHVTVDPLRDAEGAIKGALCLVSDISERKKMEIQLCEQALDLQAEGRRKDEFLAMLAHELRNPLASLANSLEIVRMQIGGNHLVEESVDVASRQIHHMTRLLEDLFDVSRITRGKVDLRKELVDFNQIVRHAVDAAVSMYGVLPHSLSTVLAPGPLQIEGDPTRLEQIVTNLLNNAVKYTEPGGQITLTVAREDGQAVLRVRDTGIGISPEMQQTVFDLFVQVDHSLDRARGGLGIGLTLVRSLVELHGGTIAVHSAGHGLGSEFTVRLPALHAAPLAPPAEARTQAHASRGRSRVLIVDDNRDSARTMARILELEGNEVVCVYDGLAVGEQVVAFQPDVLLVDIGLPGLDGYQVAEQVRQGHSTDELMLIAVTGYGGEQNHARAVNAGFDHYLVKPVNLKALQSLLAAWQNAR
jgi:PAS domain S-box-containing protein